MRRPHRHLFALVQLSLLGVAAGALAAPDDPLRCQAAIGKAGRAYAVAQLRAFVECNNDVVAGRSCDVAQRDRVVARAARALARTTGHACRDVGLETLRFPGRCAGPSGGGSFMVDDLNRCIEAIHSTATYNAILYAYPEFLTYSGAERRCQRGLARAASSFVATDMGIRTNCLDARLAGALPDRVQCFAEVQPYGPGTGDAATDDAVTQAIGRMTGRIRRACVGADPARINFPGRCFDVAEGTPDVGYVERCMRITHGAGSRHMLEAEYPAVPTPTPAPRETPSATPTPVVVSLDLLPTLARKPVGVFQNYTARAHMSDGNDRNFTQRVQYSSSDPSVAVCPNTDGNRGRVETVGIGVALITATEPISGVTSEPVRLVVSSCAHRVCALGAALVADCEPCVTTICAADPSCCTEARIRTASTRSRRSATRRAPLRSEIDPDASGYLS